MKPHSLLAVAAGLLFAPVAFSAPVPFENKTDASPVLSGQLKSVDQLRDIAKLVQKSFVTDALAWKYDKDVLSKFDAHKLKGLDTTKPVGVYAVFGAGLLRSDFTKSSIVIFVPITNEKDFIDLLVRLGLNPQKKGEIWSTPLPDVPFEATILFRKNYAYVCIANEPIDPKTLLDPRDVINDKETAALAFRLRVDQLPVAYRTDSLTLFGKVVEDTLADLDRDNTPAVEKEMAAQSLRVCSRWLKAITTEVKEIVVRADVDPKTGLLVVEKSVEAKKGTALAESIAGLKQTKNDFADIIGTDSAAHVIAQTPVFVDDARDLLIGLSDMLAVKAQKELARRNAKEVVDLIAESLHTVSRTLKTGHADFAASLRGPDKNDQYTAVAAMSIKDPAALEKAIKSSMKAAPNDVAKAFKFDVFKVGEINVHEIAVAEEMGAEMQKIFGKSSIYYAFSPNAAYAAFGPRGKETIKELMAAKHVPKPAPLFAIEMSGKRMAALLKSAEAPTEGLPGQFVKMITKLDRLHLIGMKVEGGDRLVVRSELSMMYFLAFEYFD